MTETVYFEIGSAKVVGERAGAGQLLVFLHAGVADRRMWRAQIAEHSDHYQAVAYDRRGFGATRSADEVFSHVEDLRAVLDQLSSSSVALVGCSQGGRIAIDFALAYPQRVNRLVLIAPAISGAPAPETFPDDIQVQLEALDEAEAANDLGRVNALEANLWLDGPTSPSGRVAGEVRDLFLDMNETALRAPALTQELESPAAYARVSELTSPVLVIWGELDFPHIKERCRRLVGTIAAAKGIELPGAAHLPSLEQPAMINKLLREFLQDIARFPPLSQSS